MVLGNQASIATLLTEHIIIFLIVNLNQNECSVIAYRATLCLRPIRPWPWDATALGGAKFVENKFFAKRF